MEIRNAKNSSQYVHIDGDIAIINLTQGKVAVVDAEDSGAVGQWLWFARFDSGQWYAHNGDVGSLHRYLLGDIPDGMVVDHADQDGLNNRRSNLRLCTKAQNAWNAKAKRRVSRSTKTSRYKGVCRLADRDGWRAQLYRDGRHVYLGHFPTEECAALAYDQAARSLFGDFALTNFPAGPRT